MKTKEVPINLDQDVELTIQPDFQSSAFVIVGDAETVMPIAEQAQAYDTANEARRSRVSHASRKVGTTMLEAPKAAVNGLLGRVGLDIKTVAYDKVHGTSFYDALRQKREDERNLKFATSIGLISLTDVSCRKHAHAVAKMRGL